METFHNQFLFVAVDFCFTHGSYFWERRICRSKSTESACVLSCVKVWGVHCEMVLMMLHTFIECNLWKTFCNDDDFELL